MSTRRLRHLATVTNSNVDKVVDHLEVPIRLCNYVDVYKNGFIDGSIDFSAGSATKAEIERFGLRAGDVIITKDSEDRFDIGVPAYVRETADDLVCGYHLSLLRAKPEAMRGAFLFWALQSKPVRDEFANASYGITRYGLTLGSIKNTRLPCPDLPTQKAIADFLDRETARIDQLIEKKQRLVELVDERRASLISSAVTGQIDPVTGQRRTVKGSCRAEERWFSDLPPGWSARRIKALSPVRRGASPRPIDDPIYFDDEGEVAWVRISDVTKSNGRLVTRTQRLSNLGVSNSILLPPGKLFLSIAGSVGKPCVTGVKACIHDGFVYFQHLLDASESFLYWVFEGGECFSGLGKLGTQLNLNTETVGNISIPFPPLDAQKAIARFLDCRTASARCA